MAAKSPVVTYMQRLCDSLAEQHRRRRWRSDDFLACELSILDKPHAGQTLKEVKAAVARGSCRDEKMGDVALVMLKAEPADVKDFLT